MAEGTDAYRRWPAEFLAKHVNRDAIALLPVPFKRTFTFTQHQTTKSYDRRYEKANYSKPEWKSAEEAFEKMKRHSSLSIEGVKWHFLFKHFRDGMPERDQMFQFVRGANVSHTARKLFVLIRIPDF